MNQLSSHSHAPRFPGTADICPLPAILLVILALAVLAPLTAWSAPQGGVLDTYDTLDEFLDAVVDPDAVVHEDFSSQRLSPGIPMACDNPQHSRMGVPATSFINRCFEFGDLHDGYAVRIEDGGILRLAGSQAFGGQRPTSVLGTFPGLQATLIDFVEPRPTEVALDIYQPEGDATIIAEVFAFDGALLDTFELDPASVNDAAFLGFSAPAPIGQVRLLTTSPGMPEAVGEMWFGGGTGRFEAGTEDNDFGTVALAAGAEQAVEVTNAGALDLAVEDLSPPPGPFSLIDDGCSDISLEPGASCNLVLGFDPEFAGDFTTTMTVSAGEPFGDSLELELSARAVASALSLVPQRLEFGAWQAGETSDPLTLRLANHEAVAVNVSAIGSPASPFTPAGGDCPEVPFVLDPGEWCELSFEYTPPLASADEALIAIESDGLAGTGGVQLSGRGLGPAIAGVPGSLEFGGVEVGESATETFEITNPGTAELAVAAIAGITEPFSIGSGDCPELPFSLAAGSGCTLGITFEPDAAGTFSQDVAIESDAPDSPAPLSLAGEGLQAELAVSPAPLDLGAVLVGDSATAEFTVANTGNVDLDVEVIGEPTAPFALVGGSCSAPPFTLAPDAECTVAVEFAPTALGHFETTLAVDSSAGSVDAGLTGAGVDDLDNPVVLFETGPTLDFGHLDLDESVTGEVVVRNAGGPDLQISEVNPPEAPFSIVGGRGDGACAGAPFVLAAGEACTWTIAFEPQSPGTYTDGLEIASNAASSPDSVTVLGVGGPVVIPALNRVGLLMLILLVLAVSGWVLYRRAGP